MTRKNKKEIQICLNCSEPECIIDFGCLHIGKAAGIRSDQEKRKRIELSSIERLLPKYNGILSTKVILEELKISRSRIELLKRRGRIKTMKIHNGRGGLRIIGVVK